MNSEDAVSTVIRALDAIGMPHMLTGSLASNLYGVPRSSHDADLVLQTLQFDFAALRKELGPGLHINPQLSFESITGTYRYNINKLEGKPFKVELFFLSDDPHDRCRFERRRPTSFDGHATFVASPEDVVITKLRWWQIEKRNKDIDDVRNVLAVQRDSLDWPYIEKWCDQHGTRKLLDDVRAGLPS